MLHAGIDVHKRCTQIRGLAPSCAAALRPDTERSSTSVHDRCKVLVGKHGILPGEVQAATQRVLPTKVGSHPARGVLTSHL
jgi:hypothetical protein